MYVAVALAKQGALLGHVIGNWDVVIVITLQPYVWNNNGLVVGEGKCELTNCEGSRVFFPALP